MTAFNKKAGAGDVSQKTYYIHPAAFGSTKDPGHGHVPVVKADDFEKLRSKLEAAERLITEWEQRELSNKRQLVINGLCESGEPFWEIDDYMKKWDAEHPREAAAAGIGVKGE